MAHRASLAINNGFMLVLAMVQLLALSALCISLIAYYHDSNQVVGHYMQSLQQVFTR